MSNAEIERLATEAMEAGFWFIERDERHTPERCAVLERALNKLYSQVGRECVVRLDRLGMTMTMLPAV